MNGHWCCEILKNIPNFQSWSHEEGVIDWWKRTNLTILIVNENRNEADERSDESDGDEENTNLPIVAETFHVITPAEAQEDVRKFSTDATDRKK